MSLTNQDQIDLRDCVEPGDLLRVRVSGELFWTKADALAGGGGPAGPGEYAVLIIDPYAFEKGASRDMLILLNGVRLRLDAKSLGPMFGHGNWRLSGRLDILELLKPEV